jgi:autotransporter-associated beta strand protein
MTFNNNATNYTFVATANEFITGTGGLIKNGNGSVTLNNPNSFTGDTTINGGTLILGSYGGGNQVMLYNGVEPANLVFSGAGTYSQDQGIADTQRRITFAGLVLNSGGNGTIQQLRARASNVTDWMHIGANIQRSVGSSCYIPDGTLGRAGSISGVYFTNTIPWTNGLMGGGWLHCGTDWYLASTNFNANLAGQAFVNYYVGAPATWVANSNISVNATTASVTTSPAINTLRMVGPATVTISAGQTLTNQTGGVLMSSASTGPAVITGGTIKGAAGADLIVLPNNTLNSLTIGSVIADNGSATALTLGGLGGTLILTNNNTYTGNTYINAGTMQVGAGAALGSIATTAAILDNGNLAFNRPDATSVPAVSGSGNLTQAGTGTLTLTADNSLSGLVIISAGTLQLGNGGAAGSISNTVGVADSGTLAVNNSSTVGYAGVISGVGVLVQQGPGTLILKTNETYSGLTAVTGGTLVLPSGSSISNTVAIVVGSGALLDASANGLTLRSAVPAEILAGSGSITGNVATASGTILTPGTNGVIGTLTLKNNLNLNGGSYFFDVGTNASDKILVGGTLAQTAGLVQVNPTTSLTNGVYNLISATGGLSGSPASLAVYVPGLPSGKLAVLTNATGQSLDLLVYSGIAPTITWVGDGVNNFWNSSVNSIWKDSLNNPILYANQDFVTFDDTGSTNLPVDLNVSSVFPNTITVNSTNHNYTIGSGGVDSADIIGGGASLVKNGPGTLTLQSVNSYVAGTAINGGTIKLNGAGTSASADGMLGAGPVTNNGVLIANNFTNETIAGDITGSGNLIQAGRGTLVLAGNNSAYSGAVTVASNSLQVGNGASGTLGTGNVTNNGTLLFNLNTPQSVTVSGNISGSGSITNLGSGTVILSGINSYAGNTTIPAGTLKVGSVGAIPGTTTIVLDDGSAAAGSLDLNGNDISIANLSGTNTGAGTATFRASQILNNGSGTNTITISGVVTNNFYGQIIDNNNAGSGRVKLAFLNGANYTLSAAANSAGAAGISNSTFSGGVIISNATLSLGISIGNATIGNNAGGNSGSWNGGTGPYLMTGTNAVLNTWGSGGNGGPTLITTLSTLTVPAGQSATVVGPLRGTFTCTLLGAGRLTYLVPNLQRDIIAGDWSAFTGVVIFGAVTAGQVISYTDNNGLPNAGVYFRTNASAVVFFSGRTTGNVFRMGALDGGDDTSALSGVTSANGNGGLSPIYAIGGLNSNSIFGGRVVDVNVGLRKVGTGTLTLTNNILNFSGQCVVSNGTLAFAPLGNNPVAFNPLTNNYLVCSNFTVVDPGILDVSQAGGTIYLGHNVAAGQSLFGSGTINGNLTTMTGTNTLIAPAWGVTGRPPTPGKLKITGTATNNFPCTLNMYVSRTNGPTGGLTNDSIVANIATTPTVPTINSTRLNVFINGDTNYPPASSNVFRFFIGSVPVGSGSGITNITVPVLPAGMFWVTNLTLDGSMAIVNTNPAAILAFTNTPGITNFGLAGLNVQLSGTNGQSGVPYYLRVSTNAALTFSNWTTVATNTFATVGGFTFIGTNVVDTNAPQQFYILSNTNK